MTYWGPWIQPADQTSTVTGSDTNFGTAVISQQLTTEDSAANTPAAGGGTPIITNAVAAGTLATTGSVPAYFFQQFAGQCGWKIADLEVIGPTPAAAVALQVDTSTASTAVHNADVHVTVTPSLTGTNTGDLNTSTVRVALRHVPWVPRTSATDITLHDIYTGSDPQGERAYSAGAGVVTITAVPISDFHVSGLDPSVQMLELLGYTNRNDDHPLTLTLNDTDYVAWDIQIATVITFTPLRYRWQYAVTPRLRQYPRDDFLGGAPRQGHVNQPKSNQASSRQGWAGTYR